MDVFKKIQFAEEISNRLTNSLFGTKVYKTLKSCWYSLLAILQWTNTTSVISRCHTFSPFLNLVILFSVFPSYFIVSGVKPSRLYPFLILNKILFSLIYISLLMDYQCFIQGFLKYTQNDLEYLIQNMIHQAIQICHSMLELIF